ncbi:DUF1501 domain-containing protein [Armatimonas sp.]|uniref:DUF1501 domain-containing protein n=1 Tax=Armatimonas sp. TaxID=1872638 RepID=UPI003752847D
MHTKPTLRCDGVNRREFLTVGALSALGLTLGDALRASAASSVGRGLGGKSCILIWLDGGPSHLDTFDPKPDAPSEVRGPFSTISTRIPGIALSEHLPRTAQVLDKVALIRSLTHELGNHDTGSHFLLTGHRPNPALAYPSLGSIVAKERGNRAALPPYVVLPEATSALGPGYLSGAFGPFAVGRDPAQARDLALPEGLTLERLGERRAILEQLDRFSQTVEANAATQSRDAAYEQAYRLLAAPEAKAAFDLAREPASLHERYGRSKLGTACLTARRLVEAGARFITVVDSGWDTHQNIAKTLPDALFPGSGKLPALDRAYAALLTDLSERGLLENTLVVLMGEFGRTPKLNALGGRDHWPRAGFACLAGGGVRGGQVIGKTDASGESPTERPVRPEDLSASILTLLGIDPATEYHHPDGRPLRLINDGIMLKELV